jgi:hypothetical protein
MPSKIRVLTEPFFICVHTLDHRSNLVFSWQNGVCPTIRTDWIGIATLSKLSEADIMFLTKLSAKSGLRIEDFDAPFPGFDLNLMGCLVNSFISKINILSDKHLWAL